LLTKGNRNENPSVGLSGARHHDNLRARSDAKARATPKRR
jgi:hypothetical protein